MILVESFKTVWKFDFLGHTNVITPVGSIVSDEQVEIINQVLGPYGEIIIMFDADESGQVGADEALIRLGRKLFIKTTLRNLITQAKSYMEIVNLLW